MARYVVKNCNGRVWAFGNGLSFVERTARVLSWQSVVWVMQGKEVVSKWFEAKSTGELEPLIECDKGDLNTMRCGCCGSRGAVLKNVKDEYRGSWRTWSDLLITVDCWLPCCGVCGSVVLNGYYIDVMDAAFESSLRLHPKVEISQHRQKRKYKGTAA